LDLDCQRDVNGRFRRSGLSRYKRLASNPSELGTVLLVGNPAILNGEFVPPVSAVKKPSLYE
jgi:hypothetical protein